MSQLDELIGGDEEKRECPYCHSKNTVKCGTGEIKYGSPQRYKCKAKNCRRKFSDKSNIPITLRYPCRLSAIPAGKAKKLVSQTEINTVAGDMENIEISIAKYHGKLNLDGKQDSTVRLSRSCLRSLQNRGADLNDPESVREVISKATFKGRPWSGSRKRNVITAYTGLLDYLGLTWFAPKYEINRKIPFIPTEQEIDDIIAAAAATSTVLAAFLQLLKETAMRRGEAIKVPWKDVDLERRVIMCNYPEKGSNPRIFSDLSAKLLNMLCNLPRENEMLFGKATDNMIKNQLCRLRKKVAYKLGNPRLNGIHCHTFRHWKATMMYHFTKDILAVAEFLGHKDLENTRLYIQLEKNLFKNLPNDEFITRIANDADSACKLIEVGFEYITGEYNDGGKIFRKRK